MELVSDATYHRFGMGDGLIDFLVDHCAGVLISSGIFNVGPETGGILGLKHSSSLHTRPGEARSILPAFAASKLSPARNRLLCPCVS